MGLKRAILEPSLGSLGPSLFLSWRSCLIQHWDQSSGWLLDLRPSIPHLGTRNVHFFNMGTKYWEVAPGAALNRWVQERKVRVMSLPPPSFEEVALFLSLSLSTVHMLISSNPHYLRTEMTGLFVFWGCISLFSSHCPWFHAHSSPRLVITVYLSTWYSQSHVYNLFHPNFSAHKLWTLNDHVPTPHFQCDTQRLPLKRTMQVLDLF